MFKSQMKCQKILCLVALILAAVLFVYAIGFITSFYDQLYFTFMGSYTHVDGADMFWEFQSVDEDGVRYGELGFVDQLIYIAIVDIALALLLYITRTDKRRLYHIGNFVSTGLFTGYNVGVAGWLMYKMWYFGDLYRMIDPVELEDMFNKWVVNRTFDYDAPLRTLALGYVIAALLILVGVAVALNLVWKIMLQKRENKMLQTSSVQEVAVNG